MSESQEVSELLLRWEELRERGSDPTPEDLCGDQPELIEAVREGMADLRRMDPFLEVVNSPSTGDWLGERDTPDAVKQKVAPVAEQPDPDAVPPAIPGCMLKGGKENIKFGGMGVVYFGTDISLGRPVAVKVLRQRLAANPEMVSRFEAEARINAQLQHPGIVPVHQVGKLADGRPFYTMKLVRGETFSDVLERRSLPAVDLLGVLGQFRRVCEAMAYAHAHNVLHRDLKPTNVMVGDYGEVLLMDWGLAKVLGEDSATADLTPEVLAESNVCHLDKDPEPGSRLIDMGAGSANREPTRGALGTISYVPPEQASGRVDEVDKRSDVFGLGAILCTILTGEPPYLGADAAKVERKAIRGDLKGAYRRLGESGADEELVVLARRCLSVPRDERPSDADVVAKAVASYLAGVEERRRQAELEKVKVEAEAQTAKAKAEAEAREQKKRRRAQLVWGMTIALLLIIGVGFGWWYDKQSTKRQMAEADRVNRNAEALAALIGTCEESLRAGDADRARIALTEAERRLSEGGREAVEGRLARCRADLSVLIDLDAIDTFRWTPITLTVSNPSEKSGGNEKTISKFPDRQEVVYRLRAAFERFGVAWNLSAEESARRIIDSLVSERLLGALDLWSVFEPSVEVRAILKAADPDRYREVMRDAVLAGRKDDVAKRADLKEALKQPVWYAAVLGQISGVSEVRSRELLEAALQSRPGDFILLMSLGKSYPINQREGAEDRARWFQAAVATHPRSTAAHNNLGIALNDKGDVEGAIREYQAAIKLDPTYALPHNNLGNALKAKGDVDRAIREYRAAIKLDPKDALPHGGLGSALQEKGDVEGAIREYQAAIKLDPKSAISHNNMGYALSSMGDIDGAIREYQTAIAIDSHFAISHYNLGCVLHDKRDVDGAIREYQSAITVDPKYAAPHTNLGNALYGKGDVDGAIREYQAAINIDPKYANPHNGMGVALNDKGDVDGAIREYQAAIKLDSKYSNPHANLGNALRAKGDVDGATREYQAAMTLDPKSANPHNDLGLTLYGMGDVDGAIREYQVAITVDPKSDRAHHNLGKALLVKGDVDGAIRELRTAITLDPKSAAHYHGLGCALQGKGDVDGAIREYKEAARLKNRWAPTYNNLAELLSARGESFAALQVLRDGLKIDHRFLEDFRYKLSCYSCLVASGKAKDEPKDVDRPGLRREALALLTDDLTAQKKLAADARNKAAVHKVVLHWLEDSNLESVRDVKKLPEAEQTAWTKLWADVRKLRDDTTPPEIAPMPRLAK